MIIIPAIDIQGGKAVRLTKGVLNRPTVYSDNPPQLAETFIDAGIKRLHIVDLDGAKAGSPINLPIVEKIAKLGIDIEVGGGIRDMDAAKRIFDAGAAFIIIGTAAIKYKQFVFEVADSFPQKVILGIDARNGFAALNGWQLYSKLKAAEVAAEYKDAPIESIIYTDIENDGTLNGLNISGLTTFANVAPFKVIASGGISCKKDIDDLKLLSHPNILGVIVGKAIYEKKIDILEIVD
jgi:phosphoribosylformimino-5-aminoimidazole carboxamide ribotide isomerase